MEVETSNITRPPKVTFKEFKETCDFGDGHFNKCRRIIHYGWQHDEEYRWKYRIPMVGRKPKCLRAAYDLIFNEENEELRSHYIKEGNFKFPISFNFQNCYHAF